MTEKEEQLLDRELSLYVDVSEKWKQDHDQAMECYRFEDILARGVQVFGLIVNAEENWRAAIFAGRIQYSQATFEKIIADIKWWLTPCAGIIDGLNYFERSGFEVKYATEFRSCCREAQGILTQDDQFFADDRLVALRDEALDQHGSGSSGEQRPAKRQNG